MGSDRVGALRSGKANPRTWISFLLPRPPCRPRSLGVSALGRGILDPATLYAMARPHCELRPAAVLACVRLECDQLIILVADDDRMAEIVRSSDEWAARDAADASSDAHSLCNCPHFVCRAAFSVPQQSRKIARRRYSTFRISVFLRTV